MPTDDGLDAPNERFRILLIEDNEGEAERVKEYVQELGADEFELIWRADMATGLHALGEVSPDIVLLDLHLPDSFGLDTIRRMCELCRDKSSPLVIVLTGNDDQEMAREAMEDCAHEVLLKDEITPKRLIRTLRAAVQKQGKEKLAEIQRKPIIEPADVVAAKTVAKRASRVASAPLVGDTDEHAMVVGDLSVASQATNVVVGDVDRRLSYLERSNDERFRSMERENRGRVIELKAETRQNRMINDQQGQDLNTIRFSVQQHDQTLREISRNLGEIRVAILGDGTQANPGFSHRLAVVEGTHQAQSNRQHQFEKWLWGLAAAGGSGLLYAIWNGIQYVAKHPEIFGGK